MAKQTHVQGAGAHVANDVELVAHVDVLLATQPLNRGRRFAFGVTGDFRHRTHSSVGYVWSCILETWTVWRKKSGLVTIVCGQISRTSCPYNELRLLDLMFDRKTDGRTNQRINDRTNERMNERADGLTGDVILKLLAFASEVQDFAGPFHGN